MRNQLCFGILFTFLFFVSENVLGGDDKNDKEQPTVIRNGFNLWLFSLTDNIWFIELSGGTAKITTHIAPQRSYFRVSGGIGMQYAPWIIVGPSLLYNSRTTGDTTLPNPEVFFGIGGFIRLDGSQMDFLLNPPPVSIGYEFGVAAGTYQSITLGIGGGRFKLLIKFDFFDNRIEQPVNNQISNQQLEQPKKQPVLGLGFSYLFN